MRTILVPGFTQTARSWDPVVRELPTDLDVTALDVPTGLDFVETAAALAGAGGQGMYVGYSMGGRLCLQLAVDRPEVVERLVLVSTSPGIAERRDRDHRLLTDENWARMIEREDVDAFYERWLSQKLFRTLTGEARGMESRERAASVLTHQLRRLGQGVMESLWERLSELNMSVLLIVGARDIAYVGRAWQMRDAIADARVEVIEGAGHAVHLENPAEVARLIATPPARPPAAPR